MTYQPQPIDTTAVRLPGELLQLTERLADAFFLKAKVHCQGQLAVRFEFACTLAAGGST